MTRASDLAKLLGAGATILDGTTISTADNTEQLTLTSTDADANAGPELLLDRNSSSPADADRVGKLTFKGRNDANQTVEYGNVQSRIIDASDGTEDGRIIIQNIIAGDVAGVMESDGTETVFNNNSKDLDFRVESDLHSHAFFVDASNGNVLIKGSDSSVANTGFAYEYASDYIKQTSVNEVCLYLNRRSSDGTIQEFRKDNAAVGKIITQGGNIIMASGSVGVGVGDDNLYPTNGSGASTDNIMDVGDASARFDDVYATNGTIQTSDRNEKQDIEALSDAEQRVAVVAKGFMRKFRWRDSVAEKGDNARTHFGIIAQDLQDAFTAEGLDAGDYAMFISNTWWEKEISVDAVEADEENGIEAKDAYTYIDTKEEATEGYTEKTRLGVRYNQLLAFIISAI